MIFPATGNNISLGDFHWISHFTEGCGRIRRLWENPKIRGKSARWCCLQAGDTSVAELSFWTCCGHGPSSWTHGAHGDDDWGFPIEHGPLISWVFPWKMVILNSFLYVYQRVIDWMHLFWLTGLPSGKHLQKTMENHHLFMGKLTKSMGHVQ